MKKLLAIFLCTVLVICFAACSKAGGEPETSADTTTAAQQETADATQADSTVQASASADNYTLGTLVTVNGNTEFKLSGLRLDGNRSAEENNGKDFATEGIRAGFWLNERIAFYMDTDYNKPDSEDVKVICLPHRPFGEYEKMSFDEITEQAAFTETFTAQEEADYPCFEPYVHPDYFGEGDYDVLFTVKGEIAYYLVINLTLENAPSE